jgi:hypothetical protein
MLLYFGRKKQTKEQRIDRGKLLSDLKHSFQSQQGCHNQMIQDNNSFLGMIVIYLKLCGMLNKAP